MLLSQGIDRWHEDSNAINEDGATTANYPTYRGISQQASTENEKIVIDYCNSTEWELDTFI